MNREDHQEIEKEDALTRRFQAQGTEIKGEHIADEDIYTYTLSGTQFPYKSSDNFNKTFQAFVSKT